MPGTGGQHRKTEARFIQVKRKPFLSPDDSGFLREMSCKLTTTYPLLQTRGRKSGTGRGRRKRSNSLRSLKRDTKQGFNAALFYELNR